MSKLKYQEALNKIGNYIIPNHCAYKDTIDDINTNATIINIRNLFPSEFEELQDLINGYEKQSHKIEMQDTILNIIKPYFYTWEKFECDWINNNIEYWLACRKFIDTEITKNQYEIFEKWLCDTYDNQLEKEMKNDSK